jgi:N6-L-threonylcarbamoyladenine synthase
MKILAIETSCDEISAAVVADGHRILNCEIESSRHEKTGGVVPELAARAASETILKVVENSLKNAKLTFDEIDAIAVTNGPGLAGPLLVGIETARALAFLHSKKLIATHHILGHIFANFLERENFHPKFPAVVLTVSGGHNDLILWRDFFDFEILGKTRDDAAGEAFDKFGKMIGENFPAGAAVAKLAARGDATKFKFPVPMKNSGDFDFSFSGLKTAARLKINELTAQLTARLKNKNKTAAKLEIEKLYNCRPGKNS